MRSLDDAAALVAFFEGRRGRLHGFRFRDFADFKSCPPSGSVSPTDQPLGVGDGAATTFALTKAYADLARPIAKPVAGTVRVAVDGIETGDISVDAATGRVTFAAAPGSGALLTAGFEFDTPVRFDTDRIDVTLESFDAGRVVAAPLIELRI